MWMSELLIIAGFISCFMVAVPAAESPIDVKVAKEFQFTITTVTAFDSGLVLEGECFLYDRKTPSYTILIDGMEATTAMDGQTFRVEASRIDKNTEIIYHIHTTEPEKLPERRILYGFDNRGFRVSAERIDDELESIEHYHVFEKEIPQEYNVIAVVVGFNTDGTIIWSDGFRIE